VCKNFKKSSGAKKHRKSLCVKIPDTAEQVKKTKNPTNKILITGIKHTISLQNPFGGKTPWIREEVTAGPCVPHLVSTVIHRCLHYGAIIIFLVTVRTTPHVSSSQQRYQHNAFPFFSCGREVV
jgi:hypothetical protein